MAIIAVDVALLPSQKMTDRVIEANRRLLKQRADRIILDKEGCLPHISLAMGCIVEKNLADIEKILQTVAKSHSPGPLTVIGIHTETDAAGEKVSVFQIERTKQLQSLHEAVMRQMTPHFSYNVTAPMVLAPSVSQTTLAWIRNYPEKSSFENFSPHITIGFGRPDALCHPFEFTATQIALCHLGNFCTCRKVLTAAELRD